MNAQTLKYLQKDQIGKVIATGLAELYINQPSTPIKYLAEWLKTYSNNQAQMKKLVEKEKEKANHLKAFNKQAEVKAAAEHEQKTKQDKYQEELTKFKNMVTNHEYHFDLLQETLAEFIQKHLKSTGVYVAELNHPSKHITEEDTDELAHLDTASEKLLNYIGSSVSHKALLRGKSLKTNQGVTASSFSLLEEVAAPVVGEDGQEIPQPSKPKYVFVPNVVKNESMHYFKVPKLGSYLAVPVICSGYLSESNFDLALKQKLEFIKECEELEITKKTQLEELAKEKEELEKKIAELEEKHVDQSHIEPVRVELKEVEEAIVEKQNEKIQEKEPSLEGEKKKFVICTDTLGQDRVLEPKEIQFVTEIVDHFKNSWENKEKELLKKDIATQINILKEIQESGENYSQFLKKCQQLNEEEQKEVATQLDETKKSYSQFQLQLTKLKSGILQTPIFLKCFSELSKLRVPKFKYLLQLMLYLTGLKKSDINQPNRTTLNWRQIQKNTISQSTFSKILSYNPIGPKEGNFVPYAKIPHLAEEFAKFEDEEVMKYNIGLGALLEFVKKAIELRELDVEIRKLKLEAAAKEREHILEENQKIQAKLTQELDKHKANLAGEEAEKFNEEAWRAEFNAKNPQMQVPNKLPEEHDNDM